MPARSLRRCLLALAGVLIPATGGGILPAEAGDAYDLLRKRMVEELAEIAREARHETGRPTLSGRVMAAMASVPRHEFVPERERGNAYADRPLPIGSGQTISQPYIVALMSDLMDVKPGDRVLEVGTGSGYQAAVLSKLAGVVYTIEIIESLGRQAQARLARLGYGNVIVKIGDGYQGWPEHAPFDAIMVTAAPKAVPQPLIDQLKPGGKLVVPVGALAGGQSLLVVEKKPDGTVVRRKVLAVRFVPLTDTSGRQQ